MMELVINLILIISATLALTFGISFYIREKNTKETKNYILCLAISTFLTCGGYAAMSLSSNLTQAFVLRDIGLLGIEIYPLCILCLMASDMKLSRKCQRGIRYIFLTLTLADYMIFGHPDTNMFVRSGGFTSFVANNPYRHGYHYTYMVLLICVNLLMAAKWYKSMHYKREKRFVVIAVAANGLLFLGGALDFAANQFDFHSPSFFYCMGIATSFLIFWQAARKNSVFIISLQSMSEDIFSFIDTAILVFDFDKELNLSNPFARQLLELDGRKINLPMDIFEMDEQLQNQIFEESEKGITKAYRFKAHTNHKSCQVTCQAKLDESGEPICLIMIVTDMTKEDRLIQEANRANEAKSIFLAQMSHEIRTPINVVLGMNEMILRESRDADIREYATDIRSAGKQLLFLINQILDLTKIESGKMELLQVGYDVTIMVNELVRSMSLEIEKKHLEFQVQVDAAIPKRLYGDDVRIRQVISNLLTNAVKYTEKGSVSLSISQVGRYEGKVELYVEVADTGMGIREEDREKLFEGFRRLEEKRNRGIEGTGLGMSIVTKLLEGMGSELRLESVYGKGSVFSFLLTQRIIGAEPIGDYENSTLQEEKEGKKEETFIYANNAKVLVVDDNEFNRKVIRNLVKRNGIVPDCAMSGEEAIDLVRRKSYDIIFMDHMMPDMDGIETLKKLREEKLLPDTTTVIALTANAIAGARAEYIQAGFQDYLSKPIDVDQLEHCLKTYLPMDERKTEDKKINYMLGRKFCMNEECFYRELLQAFLECDTDRKLPLYLEDKDWENYRIAVHALKGNLLNIGAEQTSQKAKDLEFALKNGDETYVLEHHAEFIQEYAEVSVEIERYLGE